MESFIRVFLLFTLYCCLGWVCETAYCSIGARKFINRGFLTGPVCPVYGFGALLVIFSLTPVLHVPHSVWMVFACGIVLTSALEYLTGYLLETLFHMKWWDYTGRFCNIKGRVCLCNSLLFGLLCLALMFWIHPFISAQIEKIPYLVQIALASSVATCFLIDCFFSVQSALRLSGKLKEMHQTLAEFHEKQKQWAQATGGKYIDALQENLEKLHIPSLEEATSAKFMELRSSMVILKEKLTLARQTPFSQRRLLSAFPHLRSPRFEHAAEHLRAQFQNLRKQTKLARTARGKKHKKS